MVTFIPVKLSKGEVYHVCLNEYLITEITEIITDICYPFAFEM